LNDLIVQRFFQITAWLLILAIAFLSLVSPLLRPVTGLPHSLEHLAIFVLTGFAFGKGYPSRHQLQFASLVLFAGLIEIAQSWAPGRHARLSDFIVDASAACAGIGLAWITKQFNWGRPPA